MLFQIHRSEVSKADEKYIDIKNVVALLVICHIVTLWITIDWSVLRKYVFNHLFLTLFISLIIILEYGRHLYKKPISGLYDLTPGSL